MRIGCSGWVYKDWRETFYPEKLPQRLWLEHYSSVFDTVEINNTFYRLPSEAAVKGWASTNAGRLRVRRQGRALYDPHQAAPELRQVLDPVLQGARAAREGGQARRRPVAAAAEFQAGPRAPRNRARRPRQPRRPTLLRVPARDVVQEGHLRPASRPQRGARHGRRSALSVRDAGGNGVVGIRALPPGRARNPRRVLGGRARHLAPAHRSLAAKDRRLRVLQQRLGRIRAGQRATARGVVPALTLDQTKPS